MSSDIGASHYELRASNRLHLRARLLAFTLLCLLIVGCARQKPAPLTPGDVKRTLTGEMSQAHLGRISELTSKAVGERRARELLDSLLPFTVLRTAEPVGTFEYEFVYQSGRDPLDLKVKVVDDGLIFQERTWTYTGGNGARFQKIAEELLADE